MIRNAILLSALVLVPAAGLIGQSFTFSSSCAVVADMTRTASILGAEEDYYLGMAVCHNDPDSDPDECSMELHEEFAEEMELIDQQYALRLALCRQLGGGPYAPDLDPADFSANITNPRMPLIEGQTLVYESETEDGLETIEVTRLSGTQDINGIECAIVRDVVTLEGECIEDTLDFFSQDSAGNVWYLGEVSQNFEDGLLDNLDGSWRYGKDDAFPGVVMWADPQIGDVYRQEYLIDEAEDVGEVLALDETVTLDYGTFTGCLQTYDWTPMEPDSREHKYYADGIGVVLEIDLESGETIELIDIR